MGDACCEPSADDHAAARCKAHEVVLGGGLLLASLPISFPFMDELSAEPTRSAPALALLTLHPPASCFRECM